MSSVETIVWTCDECGRKEARTSEADNPRHPVPPPWTRVEIVATWGGADIPHGLSVDACSVVCMGSILRRHAAKWAAVRLAPAPE
jgi:hypothetical protein